MDNNQLPHEAIAIDASCDFCPHGLRPSKKRVLLRSWASQLTVEWELESAAVSSNNMSARQFLAPPLETATAEFRQHPHPKTTD